MNIKNFKEEGGIITLEYRFNTYKRIKADDWLVWSVSNEKWYSCSKNGMKDVEAEYQQYLNRERAA